jgi:Protein of unknown function (DUF2892)
MKKNVGTLDRIIRIGIGVILLSLAFSGNKWGFIGLLPLLTGLIGWCPPYQLFGFSTARTACEKGSCS